MSGMSATRPIAFTSDAGQPTGINVDAVLRPDAAADDYTLVAKDPHTVFLGGPVLSRVPRGTLRCE